MTALWQALLKSSRLVDWLNERLGRSLSILVLLMVLVSAGNAIVRKLFHVSSNAFLEIQWYLFGALFLLCSGYTLLKNGHVRLDILIEKLSRRRQAWINVFGGLLFLLPLCVLVIYLSWPRFLGAWVLHETSADAGGLVRWPVWLMIPIGFTLLALQCLSETVKYLAFLRGIAPFPHERTEKTEEEQLIEDIRRQREQAE